MLATFAMKEECLMSAPALNHLKLKIVDGVAVVDFVESNLMFETTLIQDIGQELHSLVADQGYTRLLLDFTHVQYISSAMLGQLVKLAKEVQNVKGQLKLIGLGPVLHDTFRISHFEHLFAIYDNEDQALKAFR
jgi:anti-sigma B factor antagonist